MAGPGHPSAPIEGAPSLRRADVERAVDALVDEWRTRCLWYLRPDYYPRSDEERLNVITAIQERSDLATFRRAGVLRSWLSHHSSAGSASS